MEDKHILRPKAEKPFVEKERLPRYAGPILILGSADDDWTLPQQLMEDAVVFLSKAERCAQPDDRSKQRFLRAAVFGAFAALEAFLNQVSDVQSYHAVNALGDAERDVMEEMETVFQDGMFRRRRRRYSLTDRFLFFYGYFHGKPFDKAQLIWSRFIKAKTARDAWTHPRPPFNPKTLAVQDATEVVEAVCGLLRSLVQPPRSWFRSLSELRARIEKTVEQ